MQLMLKIEIAIFAAIMMLIVINFTKKGRISIKFCIIWIAAGLCILIPVLIPQFIETITKLFGFQMFSNLIFSILIAILILISIALTIIVSGQAKKINMLIQEISIMREEIKNDK